MMNQYQLNLLKLSQVFFRGNQSDLALFDAAISWNWDTLFNYARQQCVSAIIFSVFENQCIKPPLEILLKWYVQVELIKSNFEKQQKGCQEVEALCNEANANMFVFKGLSLVNYYLNPACREFGDLDIFTFNSSGSAHEKVNCLLESKGVRINYWDKHDVFNFGGIHVEHHSYFVNNDSKSGRRINDILIHMVVGGDCVKVRDNLFFPTPDFNAIYLMVHSIEHMSYEGITLKNALDYGSFLMHDGDKVHWEKVNAILKETGWNIGFDAWVRVVEKVLDIDFSHFYIDCPNESLADKMFSAMLDFKQHDDLKCSLIKRILMKVRRVFSHKWLFDHGVIPASFWKDAIWPSLKTHIKHPSQF